jgi:hypothetical protein
VNSDGDDGGYVHRPDAATVEERPDRGGAGIRGWILVGTLVVCTLVVPGLIYLRPAFLSALGIPYMTALLVLPLVPAVVLGLTAVWAMTGVADGDGDDRT